MLAYFYFQLFDEKPLFLKAELMRRLNCGSDHLKICLPAVCFYWLDGPWRAQWNKFGFDPTKNIEAKIYQTVDFRIRACEFKSELKHFRACEFKSELKHFRTCEFKSELMNFISVYNSLRPNGKKA